jgi:hypothetical protein
VAGVRCKARRWPTFSVAIRPASRRINNNYDNGKANGAFLE